MKSNLKVMVLAVAAFAPVSHCLAQNNERTYEYQSIVTPATIIKYKDMQLTNLDISEVRTGRIRVSPTGIHMIVTAGGVKLPVIKSSISEASFALTGQADYMYNVTLPASTIISREADNTVIIVNEFTSSLQTTSILSQYGTQTLCVGATFNIPSGSRGGFSGAGKTPITVNYN